MNQKLKEVNKKESVSTLLCESRVILQERRLKNKVIYHVPHLHEINYML
jgi:hypothetical protein